MTLVKLDSGDYINLDVVEVIAEKYVSFIGDGLTYITPTDRDRIVEAMSGITKSCKYCKSDGDWVCDPDRDEAFTVSEKTDGSDGYLETYLNSKIVTIHYCPMCGRKLGHTHV